MNIGFKLERLAIDFKWIRYDKNEYRSLINPIDYVIFKGLYKTGGIEKKFFTDIKTCDARLKKNMNKGNYKCISMMLGKNSK